MRGSGLGRSQGEVHGSGGEFGGAPGHRRGELRHAPAAQPPVERGSAERPHHGCRRRRRWRRLDREEEELEEEEKGGGGLPG